VKSHPLSKTTLPKNSNVDVDVDVDLQEHMFLVTQKQRTKQCTDLGLFIYFLIYLTTIPRCYEICF